jgi:hypothetical protein
MITAMQMMLNDLISKKEVYENASMHQSVATLETSIELAEYLLEKEKEQIINAAKSCNYIGGATDIEAEEYFNKTYKNQTP